jgi:hypothetical protein
VIDMTRLRIAYVQSFRDKKTGAVFHYFRRAGFRRMRLPGLPGSTEFMAAYQAALGNRPEPIGVAKRSKPGSERRDRQLLWLTIVPQSNRRHAGNAPRHP